jgi:hypothetical protein
MPLIFQYALALLLTPAAVGQNLFPPLALNNFTLSAPQGVYKHLDERSWFV